MGTPTPAKTMQVQTAAPSTFDEYAQRKYGKYKTEWDGTLMKAASYDDWFKSNKDTLESEFKQMGSAKTPAAPPSPPELPDEGLQAVRRAQALRLMSGRGRRSTFLTGPNGDTSAPTLRKTLLGG